MSTCPMTGKQVFASKGEAVRAMSCMCKRRPVGNKALPWAKGKLTAYRCPVCKGFHLGHGVYA